MVNLLILIGAVLVATRIVGPLLRIAISMLVRLVGLTSLIALAIVVLVAVLTHGTLI